jgi:hypothetical protein
MTVLPGIPPVEMAEGERRLAYFYTHGSHGAVVCPSCAASVPEPGKLVAKYTASRAYRCGHCDIWIGPVNPIEEGAA